MDLRVNGNAAPLTLASKSFREHVSLSAGYKLSILNLALVQPNLIGPVLDFLKFYIDLNLAVRQHGLVRAGDHVFVKDARPNSWADGRNVLIGHDAIDFDISIDTADVLDQIAVVIVRRVPQLTQELIYRQPGCTNRCGILRTTGWSRRREIRRAIECQSGQRKDTLSFYVQYCECCREGMCGFYVEQSGQANCVVDREKNQDILR